MERKLLNYNLIIKLKKKEKNGTKEKNITYYYRWDWT